MEEQKTIPIYWTKEYIHNYNKQYYLKNKEKITAVQYAKTQCKYCQQCVAKFYMNNHQKTNKCKRLREMLEEENLKKLQIHGIVDLDRLRYLEEKIQELEQKYHEDI